jgi:hypothetical protein
VKKETFIILPTYRVICTHVSMLKKDCYIKY